MKCLRRLDTVAMALGTLLLLACAGGAGGGGDKDGDDEKPVDDTPPPASPDSFKRNPANELACDRPLTENPLTAPLQRLTNQEYVNTLHDLLGDIGDASGLPSKADLPTDLTEGSFSNNVNVQRGSQILTSLFENFAEKAAAGAVKALPDLMGCTPKDEAGEAACVTSFLKSFGTRAWRRPLTDDERTALEGLFAEARKQLDFAGSVETVVGAMLQSPQFLFRIEEGGGQVTAANGKQLTDYEMASRLSYLILDSMPDANLFAAADKGELSTPDQVAKQAKRLLSDPRARAAIGEFQHEWLQLERVESRLGPDKKDDKVYPDYGEAQATSLRDGLRLFVEDSFWEGDHSMTQLYTSTRGFVNQDTAAIFGVDAAGADLEATDLDPKQRMGLLTQPGFMAGWSHATEQAPILRGAFIMERILCAPSPAPPDNVERRLIEVDNRDEITYRQWVELTVEVDSCKACHQVIDGFGFLFENYDGIGAYQAKERHLDIDASNEVIATYDLDGRYENGVEFSKALGKSEQAAQCVVEQFYEYAMARKQIPEDGCVIAPLTDGFISGGFDMQELVVNFAKSTAFRFRSAAQ